MSDDPALAAFDPDKVERALQHLRHREREALLLRAREGLTYAEIGTLLSLTPTQAEQLVAAALAKLHARLARRPRPWWAFR